MYQRKCHVCLNEYHALQLDFEYPFQRNFPPDPLTKRSRPFSRHYIIIVVMFATNIKFEIAKKRKIPRCKIKAVGEMTQNLPAKQSRPALKSMFHLPALLYTW